jgi:hypothetical protein
MNKLSNNERNFLRYYAETERIITCELQNGSTCGERLTRAT